MLRLDIPITKVDAAQRLVYGLATAEVPDRSGEICDYASTKPLYEKWSEAIAASSGGKSFGNLRAMHGAVAAGKVTALAFNDAAKQIEICAKVVDDAEWSKVEEGVYTGFSQGGAYARRWTDESGAKRYTADPHEISLVDLPCLAEARFELIKADGSLEVRAFKEAAADPTPAAEIDPADLGKAGARNNAEDQARIQAMHDTAVDLGATCGMDKGIGRIGADLRKIDETTSVLVKQVGLIGERLAKTVADLATRLDAIERQPMPLPIASNARAVGKSEDALDEDRITAMLEDPHALSLLAIKLAQRQAR